MSALLWIVAAAAVLGAVWFLAWRYRRLTETRVVSCPETSKTEAVRLAAGPSLTGLLESEEHHHLKECSRWPERVDCDQPCLSQIVEAPDGCRLRALLDSWYSGRSCVLCGRDFPEHVGTLEQRPGLMDDDGRILAWQDVPEREIVNLLETHRAVCWDCFVVEKVRSDHPDLVTDRPHRPDMRAGAQER